MHSPHLNLKTFNTKRNRKKATCSALFAKSRGHSGSRKAIIFDYRGKKTRGGQ